MKFSRIRLMLQDGCAKPIEPCFNFLQESETTLFLPSIVIPTTLIVVKYPAGISFIFRSMLVGINSVCCSKLYSPFNYQPQPDLFTANHERHACTSRATLLDLTRKHIPASIYGSKYAELNPTLYDNKAVLGSDDNFIAAPCSSCDPCLQRGKPTRRL